MVPWGLHLGQEGLCRSPSILELRTRYDPKEWYVESLRKKKKKIIIYIYLTEASVKKKLLLTASTVNKIQSSDDELFWKDGLKFHQWIIGNFFQGPKKKMEDF